MLKLQLVGLPLRHHRRLAASFDQWRKAKEPEILLRAVPSRNEHIPLIGTAEISQIQENLAHGFTHLAVVPTRNVRDLQAAFYFDCRIVFLKLPGDFRELNWLCLEHSLDAAIEFELRWNSQIRPSNVNHPLLLPPTTFATTSKIGDFWKTCDCYREGEALNKAHNALRLAEQEHRKSKKGSGSFWLDAKRRCFAVDKTWHALSRDEREGIQRFRFCFPVPAGFHYDVCHESGGSFFIEANDGQHKVAAHANVDCWGHARISD